MDKLKPTHYTWIILFINLRSSQQHLWTNKYIEIMFFLYVLTCWILLSLFFLDLLRCYWLVCWNIPRTWHPTGCCYMLMNLENMYKSQQTSNLIKFNMTQYYNIKSSYSLNYRQWTIVFWHFKFSLYNSYTCKTTIFQNILKWIHVWFW